MALGAGASRVLGLVVREGAVLVTAGVTAGLVIAWGLTRLMEGLLYEVSPTDPATFVVVPLLLAGVGLAASYLPARRAIRVDPMMAMRSE
jgi:putative ABC transport system permease protein